MNTEFNPYDSPQSSFAPEEQVNNSGKGSGYPLPPGIKGWSWGGFFFGWLWAVCNGTWIGLLTLVPYLGLIMKIALGINGREWAWRNKRWDSVAHFQHVQRLWSLWAGALVGVAILGIVAAVVVPAIG